MCTAGMSVYSAGEPQICASAQGCVSPFPLLVYLSAESGESLLLTPSNAEMFVNTMCRMRGAALKIGQVLSIQGMVRGRGKGTASYLCCEGRVVLIRA